MSELKIEKLKRKMRRQLDKERYEHTLGVMYTAAALAMRYQTDLEEAVIAGLLHDCAKCISDDKKVRLCKKYHIQITDAEKENPGLLHAKLGAYIAKKTYCVHNKQILDAITYHTTGRPDMTILDKIIYIADYIEPNRCQAPNLDETRLLAFEDIDKCLFVILRDSLAYLETRNEVIDPMTQKTYEYYQETIKN